MTPGIQVKVVNSYAADNEAVSVTELKSVDLPTDGKPIMHTLALPNRLTSKPYPLPSLVLGSSNVVLNLASLAFS